MTEQRFAEAVLSALTDGYLQEYMQLPQEQSFSAGFEKKMNRLIKRRRRVIYPLISTAMRRAACLLVIIGAGLILSFHGAVFAIDRFADDFVFFESGGRVTVFSNRSEGSPAVIESRYAPAYLPQGFTLARSSLTEHTLYLNYNNGYEEIFFTQYTRTDFILTNSSELMKFSRTDIAGHSALIREFEDWCELYWDNGEYIIAMTSTVGKDALIQAAESVQKNENIITR